MRRIDQGSGLGDSWRKPLLIEHERGVGKRIIQVA